jgi:hypothetical protein
MPDEHQPPLRNLWCKGRLLLLIPWLVVLTLVLASDAGWFDKLENALPSGWINWHGVEAGVVALFTISFGVWAYLRNRERGYEGPELLIDTVLVTAVLTVLSLLMLQFVLVVFAYGM